VSSPTRAAQVGNVPPIADTLPGFDAQSWTGMIAPTGTPRPILDRLHAAVVKALASPEVREKLAGQGVEVVGSTQAEFGEWLARETQRWSRIIRERNITVE
jgi:tripartite-type tricarboxylate transporter receptor subunit TctC